MVSTRRFGIDINKIKKGFNSGLSICDLSNIHSISKSTIYRRLISEGVDTSLNPDKIGIKTRKHKFDYDYFSKINTKEKAYIFGLSLADGSVNEKTNQFKLKLTDIELVEKVAKEIKYSGPLYDEIKSSSKHKATKTLVLTSKKIVSDLVKNGCVQNKTKNLAGVNINSRLMSHFIRGYFDGDGCIWSGMHSNKINYMAEVKMIGTIKFCTYLKERLSVNGIYSQITKDKRICDEVVNIVIRRKEDVIRFYNFIYKENGILLKRKKDKFQNYFNNIGYGFN